MASIQAVLSFIYHIMHAQSHQLVVVIHVGCLFVQDHLLATQALSDVRQAEE